MFKAPASFTLSGGKKGVLWFILLLTTAHGSQAYAGEDKHATQAALHYLNSLRGDLKLTPLTPNPQLKQSAYHHARYGVSNNQQGHDEQSHLPNFSGKTPQKRAFQAGYASGVSEVISYNAPTPQKYIDDLMSAIYHRLSLLDMTKDEIGASIYQDKSGLIKGSFVANLGNSAINKACQSQKKYPNHTPVYLGVCHDKNNISSAQYQAINRKVAEQNPNFIMWPKSGSQVPPVFYEEHPDPLPNCNVSGYPVHIQINPNRWGKIRFLINSFKLTDVTAGQRKPVKAVARFTNQTDPNQHHLQDIIEPSEDKWFAFFPKQRLNWNSRYQAEVQFIEKNRLKTTRWNFFTPKLPGLVIIKGKQKTLNASPNQILHLYLPPKTCQTSLSAGLSSKHSRGLRFKAQFIDTQTLKVSLGPQKGKLILNLTPSNAEITIYIK